VANVSTETTWPRASSLLTSGSTPGRRQAAVVGVSTYATSISPRSALSTPIAIRAALERYSTWSHRLQLDLAEHWSVHDLGDVEQPDALGGSERVAASLARRGEAEVTFVLGGDNAATWHALSSVETWSWGLITLDAHYDLREGQSNGSPVRQLLEQGLDPTRVIQVGLNDFANSAHYARRACDLGLGAITRDELRRVSPEAAAARALEVAGSKPGPIYLDIDLDVCDRSVVPGCPAAMPGGLSADELRRLVSAICRDPRVQMVDLTEIDVERDENERTVRLAALLMLDALAGRLES
jgi:formiminoglutamase